MFQLAWIILKNEKKSELDLGNLKIFSVHFKKKGYVIDEKKLWKTQNRTHWKQK